MKHVLLASVAVAIGLTFSSCVSSFEYQDASPKTMRPNDIVVVGSVKMNPEMVREVKYDPKKLAEGENAIGTTTKGISMSFLITRDVGFMGAKEIDLGNYQEVSRAFPDQGNLFYAQTKQGPVLYLKGFDVGVTNTNGTAAHYIGRFKIDIPEGAKAVYIGSFVINRDEFYVPNGYKIVDEYDKAKAEFAVRFPGFELVRADVSELKD